MAAPNKSVLKVVSLNCRGLVSSLRDVQLLCDQYDVVFLQETWLAKQNLDFLNTISKRHYSYGICSVDYEQKIYSGRPFGGTAILWNKQLKASSLCDIDESIIGLTVDLDGSTMTLVNVYLPYCCEANTDKYLEYLGNLSVICENHQNPNLCILGDFNASSTNMFGSIFKSFCQDQNLILSDDILLPNGTFTYVSEAHGSCSWIDHCVSSSATHKSINKIEVLHNFITSDHRPLSVFFNCNMMSKRDITEPDIPVSNSVKWEKVSQQQKADYSEICKIKLTSINPPLEVLQCTDASCCDQSHLKQIDDLYASVVAALMEASNEAFTPHPQTTSFVPLAGWNRLLKDSHSTARVAYLLWKNNGKPKNGELYDDMVSKRKKFKYELRHCKKRKEQLSADALAEALHADSSPKSFWQKLKSSRKLNSLPALVGGVTGVQKLLRCGKITSAAY